MALLACLPYLSQPAQADPDPLTTSNGVAYFEGNQSNGGSWTAIASVPSIVVRNLTTDITPESGTAGINLTDNKRSIHSSVTYFGGDHGIRTTGANAAGIRVTIGASDGDDGDPGYFSWGRYYNGAPFLIRTGSDRIIH